MDPLRDTPLKRFGALWIGLFIALSFAIAMLVLAPFFKNTPADKALEEQYKQRLAIKSEVDAAQAEQFAFKQSGSNAQVAPELAFGYTAKQLLNKKPAKTDQIVPGSPTDLKANAQ